MITETVQHFLDVQAKQLDWYCDGLCPAAAAELRRRIKERTRHYPRPDMLIEAAYCEIPRGVDIEAEKASILATLLSLDPIMLLDMDDNQITAALTPPTQPVAKSLPNIPVHIEPVAEEEASNVVDFPAPAKAKFDPDEFINDLRQFSGSERFHKWTSLAPKSVLTEGANYLADKLGAYWLMDIIASYQHESKVRAQPFQTWKLTVKKEVYFGNTIAACVLATNGNDSTVIAKQSIPYTDFPLPEILLYATRNELGGITIMLPSEY